MSEVRTMVRTRVAVDDVGFLLAQGQDIDAIKQEIESAMRTGPRFVDLIVVGNRSVSILISAQMHIVITVETVPFDERDTGDDTAPFGGLFDLL
ncbi:hypothetical protein AB3M89_09710 [Microbacterium sp. 179-I 3D2 NHS]|uniref:hypothetical protein n=1 Tax=Microbacterium sp. 179-I 3D2 NHS TaxID=3235178 RepID=UPI0039A03DBB